MDPDGWPIIFFVTSVLLYFCSLGAGVTLEKAPPKAASESGIGIPMRAAAAILECVLLLVINFIALSRIAAAAAPRLLSLAPSTPMWVATAATVVLVLLGAAAVSALCVALPLSLGRAEHETFFDKKRWLTSLALPFEPLARLICAPAASLLRRRGTGEELGTVTEEDVLDDVGELDEIDDNQREMIGNIFELDDVTSGDIMTHRIEVEAVPEDAELGEIVEKAVSTGYSRLPVYEESLDSIIGAVSVKDLLPYVGRSGADFNIHKIMRSILYVHESCPASELMLQFKTHKLPLAVVVDEYGGTAGIVSLEDILESIVGDIADEYDEDEKLIMRRGDGSLVCDGHAGVDEVCEALHSERFAELIESEETDSETIGGLLTSLLGRIPERDERAGAMAGDVELTSLVSDERRISKVLARRVQNRE